MIPGANLLGMALRLLSSQNFDYFAFLSRGTNDIGQDLANYAEPQSLAGSVQPVPRSLFQLYGLDFDRNYLTFYVSQDVIDVTRDVSGDQMFFNGNTYQCIQKTDWFPQDGWTAVLAVQVPTPIQGIYFITSDGMNFQTSLGEDFIVLPDTSLDFITSDGLAFLTSNGENYTVIGQ
jgi:hypothetical protein